MVSSNRMTVRLHWQGEQRFQGTVDGTDVVVDGEARAGASPVQMLTSGLAGCMAIDVVHILDRMRTPATSLDVELTIERAASDPRRVVRAAMEFVITGDVPDKNVQRALDLSRETYCSVWHSLRRDIDFSATFRVEPA